MIIKYGDKVPAMGKDVYVADSADIIGEVNLGEGSGIWYGAAVRADLNSITIGANSNIQDNSVVHVSRENSVSVGRDVIIGHNVILHGCTVGNNCLIGMGAILLDGCTIGDNCMVAAGAIVTPGSNIEPGSLVIGIPGKVVRNATPEEIESIKMDCDLYRSLAESQLVKRSSDPCSVVITTCPDEKTAKSIAKILVEKNLAACVQAEEIRSIYKWEGEMADEKEIRLTIKCVQANVTDIFDLIKKSHPYKVPEIIELPIRSGDCDYLKWVQGK